jgi:hypothetical protein
MLALMTLACGIQIDVPFETDLVTGPDVTDQISIPNLEDADQVAEVIINFGAGELSLSPGSDGGLIYGETTYNVEDMKPEISIENEIVKIKTGSLDLDGFPRINDRVKNSWDLNLGTSPVDLTIKAGAYVGDFELGGLSLVNLHIADGASEVDVNFEKPNQAVMGSLRYETGASNITLSNLANANFTTMIFESGAGNYTLDFSGQLARDANVFIETGLSTMTIEVPENSNVEISVEGGLSNITQRGSWEKIGNDYVIQGEGPTLRIVVEMNAGNLILRNP